MLCDAKHNHMAVSTLNSGPLRGLGGGGGGKEKKKRGAIKNGGLGGGGQGKYIKWAHYIRGFGACPTLKSVLGTSDRFLFVHEYSSYIHIFKLPSLLQVSEKYNVRALSVLRSSHTR